MANTKKSTKTQKSEKEEVKISQEEKVIEENEELKKQLEELKNQVSLMMAAQAQQVQQNENKTTVATQKKNRNIKFISLSNGITVLRGNKTHIFDGQFKSKMIAESEARAIVGNMDRAIQNGLVYIADADFVAECELDGVYEDLLNEKQLKGLLDTNAENVCEIYKNANEIQRKIIIDMVVEKQLKGAKVDANILMELGKLTGKDLISLDPMDEE